MSGSVVDNVASHLFFRSPIRYRNARFFKNRRTRAGRSCPKCTSETSQVSKASSTWICADPFCLFAIATLWERWGSVFEPTRQCLLTTYCLCSFSRCLSIEYLLRGTHVRHQRRLQQRLRPSWRSSQIYATVICLKLLKCSTSFDRSLP